MCLVCYLLFVIWLFVCIFFSFFSPILFHLSFFLSFLPLYSFLYFSLLLFSYLKKKIFFLSCPSFFCCLLYSVGLEHLLILFFFCYAAALGCHLRFTDTELFTWSPCTDTACWCDVFQVLCTLSLISLMLCAACDLLA